MCRTCEGEGVIFRPVQSVYSEYRVSVRDAKGQHVIEMREEAVEIGGLDICPECQAKFEAQYTATRMAAE